MSTEDKTLLTVGVAALVLAVILLVVIGAPAIADCGVNVSC